MERKTRTDALSEKISDEQRDKLILWMTRHSYSQIIDLAKAEPPDGFGFEPSKASLSRFFHEYEEEISKPRQERILYNAYEHNRIFFSDPDTRNALHEAAAVRLQEQLYDLLSHPVESARELKDLAQISKAITTLGIDLRGSHEKDRANFQYQVLRQLQKKMTEQNSTAQPGIEADLIHSSTNT
jgi:hypothetical protein